MSEYPEWQKLVREAQAQQQRIDTETQAKEDEKKRQENERKGRNLSVVLRHFGIDSAPKINSWHTGGYQFNLEKFWTDDKSGEIGFDLRISSYQSRPWKDSDIWKYGERFSRHLDKRSEIEISVSSYNCPNQDETLTPDQWRKLRANFADALDKAPSLYEKALQEWEHHVAQVASEKAQSSPEEQFVEALMNLLYQRNVRFEE